jgi:hypothetical protein
MGRRPRRRDRSPACTDQVVGADRDKSKWRRKAGSISAAGRHLDHRADLHRPVAAAGVVELLARPGPGHRASCRTSAQVRDHRQEDPHLAVRRGAQDGAQLPGETIAGSERLQRIAR